MLRTDPSRYLSAAAYANPTFTEATLAATLWNPDRLVASCPGLDIAAVVRHCVRASRRHTRLQLLVAAQPLLWVLLSQLLVLRHLSSAMLLAGLVVVVGAPVLAARLLSARTSATAQRRPRRQPNRRARREARNSTQPYLIGGVLVLLLLRPLVATAMALVGVQLVVVVLLAIDRWQVRYRLAKRLVHGAGPWPRGREPGGALRRRLEAIQDAQAGNISVYPTLSTDDTDDNDDSIDRYFADCGARRGVQGVFTLQVDKPAEESAPVGSFTAADLTTSVRDALARVPLDGATAEDRIYVADETFDCDPVWSQPSTGRSRFFVDDEQLTAVIQRPQPYARHYVLFRVSDPSWKSQLVYSMAVHVHIEGPNLTVESNEFVFGSLRSEFMDLGRSPSRMLPSDLATLLLGCLREAPGTVIRAPAALLRRAWHVTRAWLAWRRHDQIAKRAPRPRRQELFSLRHEVSKPSLGHNETMDVARYHRIALDALFDAVKDFLRAHNVDLADIDDQIKEYTVIYNQGIMAESVNAANLAVGDRASVSGPMTAGSTESTANQDANDPDKE